MFTLLVLGAWTRLRRGTRGGETILLGCIAWLWGPTDCAGCNKVFVNFSENNL